MSALPPEYQRYAQPLGQRPVQPAEIHLYDEQDPVVWIPGAYGEMVPVRKSQAPAPVQLPPARDLTPQPLFDPMAQRLLGGGIGGGVLLWGGGTFLVGASQLVSSLSGVGALLFFLALAGARTVLGGGRRGGTHIEVHNHARGFGRNHTHL